MIYPQTSSRKPELYYVSQPRVIEKLVTSDRVILEQTDRQTDRQTETLDVMPTDGAKNTIIRMIPKMCSCVNMQTLSSHFS